MIIKDYIRPNTLDQAYEILIKDKRNIILGGGAWLKLRKTEFNTAIDLSNLGLDEIKEDKDFIHIGSSVTLRQIETNKSIIKELPIFVQAVSSIMGLNVRNIATIGGSIIGKFSFSDLLAPLLVMDVTLVFHKYGDIKLQEYLDYKKFPEDILLNIKIKKESYKSYYKTVKKTALDFSVINFAITKGETLRIAIGSRPGIALRAFESEKLRDIEDITKSVAKEISVGSNSRSSKEYREELLKIYIKRGLMEVFNNEN